MSNSINATSPTAAIDPAAATAKTSGVNDLANRDTFLKLLVAQIRNQDPLNPTDGIQFVTQLAQFSSLEQNLQMSKDLGTIRDVLTQRLPDPTSTTTPNQP